MPMVWASASDIVSTVEDAARPNIAANPSRESAFRREIPSDPMVLPMLKPPGLSEVSSCTQFQRSTFDPSQRLVALPPTTEKQQFECPILVLARLRSATAADITKLSRLTPTGHGEDVSSPSTTWARL